MKLPLQFSSDLRPQVRLKSCPEDFQVDEIHDHDPGEEGEFAVVEVVKRDLTTPALLKAVAEHFQVTRDQVACAGFKDRVAVTRQRLSLPATCLPGGPPDLPQILQWKPLGRQSTPLRPGQLSGNQFRIRLRGIQDPSWLDKAWRRQQAVGFANYYGIQRFGPDNENWRIGLDMLRHPPERRSRRRWPHNFVLNSVQSQLFNLFLEERIESGRFQILRAGDWCDSLPSRGARPAGGDREEQRLLQRFELTPLGPIWGYKLERPSAEEQGLLQRLGLTSESFRPFRAPGSRRPIRLPLPKLTVHSQDEDVTIAFRLPAGSYATVLLSHFFELEWESGT
jgi:tRNA pseudouridine13 synthase